MNESHDVEPVIDRVTVTKLLVATVSLVLRRPQDRDLDSRMSLLITEAVPESVVLRRIVDDQHLNVVALKAVRDPAQDSPDRRLRVVGDDENEQPLAAEIDPVRHGRFQL